jgi:hypothetical protein
LVELEKAPGDHAAEMTDKKSELTREIKPSDITIPVFQLPRVRIRLSIIGIILGFLVVLIGAKPSWFGLDRSPVVGFIQIAVMLIGLAIICISGYAAIHALWRKQQPTIPADIGVRLVSTGYVITLFSGMADVLGVGSHPLPGLPVFGVWQARGMEIGLAIIAIGFIMMFPYKQKNKTGINPTP